MDAIELLVLVVIGALLYAVGVATGMHIALVDIDQISVKVVPQDEEQDDSYIILPSQKENERKKY